MLVLPIPSRDCVDLASSTAEPRSVWPPELMRDLARLPITNTTPSPLHRDVAHQLKKLECEFTQETSINGLAVDIVIEKNKLVIEVDGPSHFCENSRTPLGHTLFKRRLLRAMGYDVVSIAYWQWAKAKGPEAKLSLLKNITRNYL